MRGRASLLGALLVGGMLSAQDLDLAAEKTKFQKADRRLNAVYLDLKKALPKHLFSKVQEEQRAWVEHRDYIAEWDSKGQGKTPAQDAAYWETAALLTESRVKYLGAWKGIGKPEAWGGSWSDGYGGWLSLVERGGKLHFTLNVVRGPTHHLGTIGGAAEVNGGIGRFEIREAEEERPTWLIFLKNRNGDGRIEVIGENTQPFHGARAYFDGHYLRVGLLSGKEEEKVLREAANQGGPVE